MAAIKQCVVVTAALLLAVAFADAKKYNTSGGPLTDGSKLNVHIVSHTHDDVGWLKSVDNYFLGRHTDIQRAGVQYILDSVIPELKANADRKFIYVEIAFFMRWWREQEDAMRHDVSELVKAGQLEFINGGWCMHDEAATHYEAMIDQMSLGHQFLLKNFGVKPRIGWQIDPFGHSAATARTFAQMGFDAFYFGRIDYDDKATRERTQEMEVVWRSSASLGEESDILAGLLYNGYGPPPGFCFDVSCGDDPINDDPLLMEYDVPARVEAFVKWAAQAAKAYATPNLMVTMGSDFQYENAHMWYKNLDKLIHYLNQDGRVNAFYSTPSIYTDAVHATDHVWTVKTDDYFPYADCPYCYWTGYFTSRPAVKGYVRSRNNYLQTCRQITAIAGPQSAAARAAVEMLERAMGVAQHHDAVSGTEKQHVADDYARRLAEGSALCERVMDTSIAHMVGGAVRTFQQCPEANVTVCAATQHNDAVAAVLYNPLAQARWEYVRLPVSGDAARRVLDAQLQPVDAQLVPVAPEAQWRRRAADDSLYARASEAASHELVFKAHVPALGYATYFVQKQQQGQQQQGQETADRFLRAKASGHSAPRAGAAGSSVALDNGIVRLTFDGTSGLLSSMANKHSGVEAKLSQTWRYYKSSTGNNVNSTQSSGAYIFRPNGTAHYALPDATAAPQVIRRVINGSVVQEVHQSFAPSVSQVVRLYEGAPYAEFEWTVGPIPVESDKQGKEYIALFSSDIASAGVWETDANGLDMQRRVRNHRDAWKLNVTQPVSGNYVPVNAAISLADASRTLTVLTDRSQGGASLNDGQLELMAHRRLLHDDARGVGEPLNETDTGIVGKGEGLVITGRYLVFLQTPAKAARLQRPFAVRLAHPSLPLFTALTTDAKTYADRHQTSASFGGAAGGLPPNVHLLTLERIGEAPNQLLVRLAHIYQADEDAEYGLPVQVDLAQLLAAFHPSTAVEMNMSYNQGLGDMKRLKWKTKSAAAAAARTPERLPLGADMKVTINPMDIRTFIVHIES